MTRILIVEDEPRIAAFVSRGLESAGYETAADESGDPRLVLDDQDPGHPAASRCSTTSPARTGTGSSAPVGGRWMVNVAPPPGVSVTSQWPP